MRIGILCHGHGGGSTRAATDLALALHRRGLQTTLVTLGGLRSPISPELSHLCLPVSHPKIVAVDAKLSPDEITLISHAIAQVCIEHQIDVLNYHYGLPFAEACWYARFLVVPHGLKLIATLHGSDVTLAEEGAPSAAGLLAAIASVDGIVTVSQAYGQRIRALIGSQKSCYVIPNFLPKDRLAAKLPLRRKKSAVVTPVILHASSFRRVKQVHQLGRVFIAIYRRRSCKFVFVGNGAQRLSLQLMLRPMKRSVQFTGQKDSVIPALQQSDLLLLTSAAESFSLIALEAMAVGVPVIGPSIPGLCETVQSPKGGLLFTPNRPTSAAMKIMRLLNNPYHRARIALSARELAATFNEDRAVQAYQDLFAAVSM